MDRLLVLAGVSGTSVLSLGAWDVVVVEVTGADTGRVAVDLVSQQIVLAKTAWAVLRDDGEAIDALFDHARDLGCSFWLADTPFWADAVRGAVGERSGGDRLAGLARSVEVFLTEAASVNAERRQASAVSAHAARYARLQAEADALADELARVQSALLTARDAVLAMTD